MSSKPVQEIKLSYRPDIDGLRAIAVLGVFVFHCFPSLLPGGFAGVDVFFVISGYLITTILFDDCQKQRFSLWLFYSRRIRRIFPALLTCLATAWGLGYALLTPTEFKELARSIVHSAYFSNNFLLVSQAGYFDTHADLKPLLHLWSLAVEEQFYIIWPWLILFAYRFGPTGRWLIALLGLASLGACIVMTSIKPIDAFFMPQYRAWELIAGASAAVWGSSLLGKINRHIADALTAPLGLMLIAIAYFSFSGADPFPGWRAMLPVTGAWLILAASGNSPLSKLLLATRPMVSIGLISYPLYLWHWIILSFARILFDTPSASAIVGLAALSLFFAWATYQFIETPLRHGKITLQNPQVVPIGALILLISMGGVGDYTRRTQGFPQRLAGTDWQDLMWPANQVLDTDCMRALKPAGDYCMRSHTGPITHILIGDSHANHFFPGLSQRIAAHGGNLLQLQGPLKTISDPAWKNVDALVERPDIRTIYIAYHQGRMKETDNPFGGVLETTIARLLKANLHVIFIIDNPEFDFDPRLGVQRPQLASWLNHSEDASKKLSESTEYMHRKRREYERYIDILRTNFPQLAFLDAFSPLCDKNTCSAIKEGTLVFRDRHHLTQQGSMMLWAGMHSDQ